MKSISIEQPGSAHRALAAAGIRHGDRTNVELAAGLEVGAGGEPHLAFCPSVVTAGRVVWHGKPSEHKKPIAGDIVFENANQVSERLRGKKGIAVMRGNVFTNGHVAFRIDPDSIRVIPVDEAEDWKLHHSDGRVLAEEALGV